MPVSERLLELAGELELLVASDLYAGRASEGTTTLLAAANELRRRNPRGLDAAVAAAISEGMSLRNAANAFGITVSRVRTIKARAQTKED